MGIENKNGYPAADLAEKEASYGVYKDTKIEFDRYIHEIMQGAEIVGPVTLRREYHDPDVDSVLDSFEFLGPEEYNPNWEETWYNLGLEGETDEFSNLKIREKRGTGGKAGHTFGYAKGGYVGVKLGEEGIESLGMPRGHTTPVVARAVQRVVEKKKESGWSFEDDQPLRYKTSPYEGETIGDFMNKETIDKLTNDE